MLLTRDVKLFVLGDFQLFLAYITDHKRTRLTLKRWMLVRYLSIETIIQQLSKQISLWYDLNIPQLWVILLNQYAYLIQTGMLAEVLRIQGRIRKSFSQVWDTNSYIYFCDRLTTITEGIRLPRSWTVCNVVSYFAMYIKLARVRPYKINSLLLITPRWYFEFRVNIFLYFLVKYKCTGRPRIFRDLVILYFVLEFYDRNLRYKLFYRQYRDVGELR